MIQLKELQIPESTLDLRDFSDYCKTFSNYEEYAAFYENQIYQRKNDLFNLAFKIVKEYFIKTKSEWRDILTETDFEKLVDIKHFNSWHIVNDQIFIKCNKTNNFYNITRHFGFGSYFKELTIENLFSFFKKGEYYFSIKDQKIIINFNYETDRYDSPYKNRDGHYTDNNEIYTIDLLDYSVDYKHVEKHKIIPSKIPHNRFFD